MAQIPRKTMRSRIIFGAFFAIQILAGCENASTDLSQQIYMQTEDSHPHEVLPGEFAVFPFWVSDHSGYVDVKCTLQGPNVTMGLEVSGFQPKGWAARHTEYVLGNEEITVDIEGIVFEKGKENVTFSFQNKSQTGLLWHQCYNN